MSRGTKRVFFIASLCVLENKFVGCSEMADLSTPWKIHRLHKWFYDAIMEEINKVIHRNETKINFTCLGLNKLI